VVHEAESYSSLVSSSQEFLVHVDYFSCLPHHSAVDDGLVVGLDKGSLVQNSHLSFKVEDRLRLGALVD